MLSETVRKNILSELVRLYSFVVRERYKKISLNTAQFIISLIKNNKELFPLNRFKTLIYTIVPLFYTFFGKGFKLTKLANQISSK